MSDINKKIWKNITAIAMTLAVVVIVSIPIFIRPYKVRGGSMYPTLKGGDIIFVDTLSPALFPITRGELLVFHNPHKPGEVVVKRVIGLPGETVHVRPDRIIISRACDERGFELTPAPAPPTLRDGPCQTTYATSSPIGNGGGGGFTMDMYLGPHDYFMMGDDRRDSMDSRIFGAMQPQDIVGRPIILLPTLGTSRSTSLFIK